MEVIGAAIVAAAAAILSSLLTSLFLSRSANTRLRMEWERQDDIRNEDRRISAAEQYTSVIGNFVTEIAAFRAFVSLYTREDFRVQRLADDPIQINFAEHYHEYTRSIHSLSTLSHGALIALNRSEQEVKLVDDTMALLARMSVEHLSDDGITVDTDNAVVDAIGELGRLIVKIRGELD